MDLITGLTAISQTIAITKDLRTIDDKIVVAEFKLRIADMVDKLLDAKQALIEAQEREQKLLEQLAKLEAATKFSSRTIVRDGLLFELDGNGEAVGEPHCNQCFVKEGKLFQLQYGPFSSGSHKCSNCLGVYGRNGRSSSSGLISDYDPFDP